MLMVQQSRELFVDKRRSLSDAFGSDVILTVSVVIRVVSAKNWLFNN
jgi:hypothetical protein